MGDGPPRFAFMRKFEIPNFDTEGNYLTRWRIIETPWCSLYLHRIDTPDSRPTLHDHPWNFTALVLRGGYVEHRLDPRTLEVDEQHRVRFVNRIRTHDAHAIMRLLRVPTWTLCLVGARRRTWGYWEPAERHGFLWEPDSAAWTWTEFDKHPHNDEFVAALARRRVTTAGED